MMIPTLRSPSRRRVTSGSLRPQAPGGRLAFTLVEILVVLVILSLLTTTALFSYTRFRQSQSIESSSEIVRRILMQARNRAIHLNLPHQVVIDLDNDTMWIDQLNSTRTETTPKIIPEQGMVAGVEIAELLIQNTRVTTGRHALMFEPDGRNPFVVVLLRKEIDDPSVDANYYSVRLFPSSGEAQILANRRL